MGASLFLVNLTCNIYNNINILKNQLWIEKIFCQYMLNSNCLLLSFMFAYKKLLSWLYISLKKKYNNKSKVNNSPLMNNYWRFIMRISGITYVKRKRRWFSKFLLTIFILLIVILVTILCLLMFTDIQIPYISEWLES